MRILVIEDEPDLLDALGRALREDGYAIDTAGDGREGLFKAGSVPYDAIVLTGSTPVLDPAFQASLNAGGRLLAIVGDAPAMTAQLINCEAPGVFRSTGLFETCVPSLRNAPQPKRFEF